MRNRHGLIGLLVLSFAFMAGSADARLSHHRYKRPATYKGWKYNVVVNALQHHHVKDGRRGNLLGFGFRGQLRGLYDFVRQGDRAVYATDARKLATGLLGQALATNENGAGSRITYSSKDGKWQVNGLVTGSKVVRGKTYYQVLVAPSVGKKNPDRTKFALRYVAASRIQQFSAGLN
jgi:hypothetical protein